MKIIFGFILGIFFSLLAVYTLIEIHNPDIPDNQVIVVFVTALFLVVGMSMLYFCTTVMNNRIIIFILSGVIFILLGGIHFGSGSVSIDGLQSAAEYMDGNTTSNLDKLISIQTKARITAAYEIICGVFFVMTAFVLFFVSKRKAK